jgi:hypothetical protein
MMIAASQLPWIVMGRRGCIFFFDPSSQRKEEAKMEREQIKNDVKDKRPDFLCVLLYLGFPIS